MVEQSPTIGSGPLAPARATPARHRSSIRRTTTHDHLRPDGPLGDVLLRARGRDLRTGADGAADVIATAAVDAHIDVAGGQLIRSFHCDPPAPALSALTGRRATSGFRRVVEEALPDQDRTTLRHQLLDELPIALLISGVAVSAAGVHPPPQAVDVLQARTGICAGFVAGGELLTTGDELGRPPLATGAVAPALPADGDPWAWHDTPPVGAHGTRRRRRIDVRRDGGGSHDGSWTVEAFFRDSRVDGDGVEWVVHEYTVHATLGPAEHAPLVFRSCEATVGVLPWRECPGALASARRLVGTEPGDLRERVRDTFTGISTCTHLNDTLRALAVLPYLTAAADAP